jgi:hypothetical protein
MKNFEAFGEFMANAGEEKISFTMKTKLPILISAFAIVFSLATASAQQPHIDPNSGLPLPPPPAIDPATGLPADGSPPFKDANGTPTWIDPAWSDPNELLLSVNYQSLPLAEVANQMREKFTNSFDIILPADGSVDPNQYFTSIQLNNVRASEVFSAMNLQFELQRTPVRWELTSNGSRQTVLLRYLPQLGPAPPPPPPINRKVFFVGDMLDDYAGTNDTIKLNDISVIIRSSWDKTGISQGSTVDEYPAGQLLIVSGTPDQVDLAEQTLRALKEKAAFENSRLKK